MTSKTAVSRFDAVSSGPKMRRFAFAALSVSASRSRQPMTRVASLAPVPGAATVTA